MSSHTTNTGLYRHPNAQNREDNYRKWNLMIRQQRPEGDKLDRFAQIYDYKILDQVYYGTKTFRAGVILIYMEENKMEMLMVRQRAISFWDKGKMRNLPSRLGFPKGQREPADKNALETALRELYEETGINIFDQHIGARVCVPTIILPRQYEQREILIYFIVTIETKPTVSICNVELDGYSWVDMITGLRSVRPTTTSTDHILQQMKNINFRGHINSIPI